jgi:sugar transferase (PEP-CTERM system associated)
MPIITNREMAWAHVSAVPRERGLRARSYWLPRTWGAFVAAEVVMLAFLLSRATRGPESLAVPILVAFSELFFHVTNLPASIVTSERSRFSVDVLKSLALALLASGLVFSVFPAFAPTPESALVAVMLSVLLPLFLRPFLRYLVTQKKLVEGILIVGTGELAGKLHQAFAAGKRKETADKRLLDFPNTPADRALTVDIPQLNEMLARARIVRVIVAEQDPQSRESLAAALLDRRLRGLQVNDAADYYEKFCGKIWIGGLSPGWPVYTDGFNRSQASLCLKRFVDVTLALLLLLLSAPLLAMVAIAIKLESAGPVLFRQVRVGLHGKSFIIYKFRSMRQDAELETGPVWAEERDQRITRVGHFIRKFRFDELPQAFNVLRGEMSLVGPRPERPFFVERIERQIPFYGLRHYVKPGITGLAQVMYRYGASVEDACEKLQYDFYYAKHQSLRRDVAILLKTIKVVLLGRGR